MKLFHPAFSEHFFLKDDAANVIIIENGALFFSLLQEFSRQCDGADGGFILSDSLSDFPIGKCADFVGDIFSFSINERKLSSKLISRISEKALDDEHFAATAEILSATEKYMLDLISDFDVSVHLENSVDIAMLLKAMPVSVSDPGATLPEKICNYSKINFEFFGKSIFAFVNLKQFVSEEDLLEIYKFFRYEKLSLLLFEGYQKSTLRDEHILIIDKDMCII